jgi:hypothetical protein
MNKKLVFGPKNAVADTGMPSCIFIGFDYVVIP